MLIRLVLTEIQLFENVQIFKEIYGHPEAVRHRPDGLKRPSHGKVKVKLADSCWQTSKSWQTRAFTRQTHAKSQRMLNL